MSDKITITLNGKKVEAAADERLLDVCNREGVFIPTLCDHEALKPYGACRLCIVEWVRGDWSKTVTSCNFPVKDGQVFKSDSDKVTRERKMIMEFALARSSKTPEVIELAKKLGVENPRFSTRDEGCVMCGMCVRVCNEVVGANAIGYSARGPERKVSSPFDEEAGDCIGCGSCAYICPTKYIEVEEEGMKRNFPLWHVEFDLVYSKKLGQKISKKAVDFICKRAGLTEDWFELSDKPV
jgi:bidirectional [NiFe] hydrogenase diaphorase subunit